MQRGSSSLRASLVLLLLGAATASAQITQTFSTLEGQLVGNDILFIGRVVDVMSHPNKAGGETHAVTLLATELLLGSPAERVTLILDDRAYDFRYERWAGTGAEFLWGLKTENGRMKIAARVPLKEKMRLFRFDGSVVSGRDELLTTARVFCKRRPKLLGRVHVTIPGAMAARAGSISDRDFLTLPIFPQSEVVARRMLDSPAEFLTAGATVDGCASALLREAGAEILGYFPSEANRTRLRGLLDDPFKVGVHSGDNDPVERWEYPVRIAARKSLERMDALSE